MSDTKTRSREVPAYDADLYAWTQYQAARLREVRPDAIDWENVAEEIEGVGAAQKREIQEGLEVILWHLLRWQHEPEKRKYRWRVTIGYHRLMIEKTVADSPSLRRFPGEALTGAYELTRLKWAEETDLPEKQLPDSPPYSIAETLDEAFFPGPIEPDVR
jgi:hypothetical protein